jgi:hypothetical protein
MLPALKMSYSSHAKYPLRIRRILAVIVGVSLSAVFSAIAFSAPSNPMSSSPAIVDVPARIAGLSFTYLRPADFHAIELPDETPDFEQPEKFFPLQIVMANFGAVLFTVSARPAYGDGSVEDWAHFLARESAMKILSVQPSTLAGMPTIQVEATQEAEVGTMRIRMVLLEDGTRLLNLMIIAPASIWDSVEQTLQLTLSSFRLADKRGATAVLTRAVAEKATADALSSQPEIAPAAMAEPSVEPAPLTELALADDASSLDPENQMNIRLRNAGAGLAPRVLELDLDRKFARIGAGAIATTFRVPLGWHVIDDGRRTLVFDAEGKIQISLNLRRIETSPRDLLEEIKAETIGQQPQIVPLFNEPSSDLPTLILRNYRDGDDVLEQAFVVRQLRDDGLAHVARVTAAPDEMSRAMTLTESIIRSMDSAMAGAMP